MSGVSHHSYRLTQWTRQPAIMYTLEPVSSWNRTATMFTLDTKCHLHQFLLIHVQFVGKDWLHAGGKQHPLYLVCFYLAVEREVYFCLILWFLKLFSDPGHGNPTCLKRSQLNHNQGFFSTLYQTYWHCKSIHSPMIYIFYCITITNFIVFGWEFVQ